MADSASEIAAAIIVPALVWVEFTTQANSPDPAEFKCILTCSTVGSMATWIVSATYAAVLVVRLLFLTVERHLILEIVARVQLDAELRRTSMAGQGGRRRKRSLVVAVMHSLVASSVETMAHARGSIRQAVGSFRVRRRSGVDGNGEAGGGEAGDTISRLPSFERKLQKNLKTTGVASTRQLGLAASAERVFGRGGRLQASTFVSLGCIIIFQSVCQLFRVKYHFF